MKMRNEIKIRFEKPIYSINEEKGIVSCILNYTILYPKYLEQFEFNDTLFFSTGFAQLKEGDNWDVNIGKKISLAKAEQKAYAKVKKQCIRTMINVYETMCVCSIFCDKAKFVIDHNDTYIDKF